MLVTIVGETVTVLCLCLDPINMNSVLVIFRVSLFALSQLRTFETCLDIVNIVARVCKMGIISVHPRLAI